MSNWDLAKGKILAMLRRIVPEPAPKLAKPQQSFHTLKVGQALLHSESGVIYQVVSVDSTGARIAPKRLVDLDIAPPLEEFRVLDKNWKQSFDRIRQSQAKAMLANLGENK